MANHSTTQYTTQSTARQGRPNGHPASTHIRGYMPCYGCATDRHCGGATLPGQQECSCHTCR